MNETLHNIFTVTLDIKKVGFKEMRGNSLEHSIEQFNQYVLPDKPQSPEYQKRFFSSVRSSRPRAKKFKFSPRKGSEIIFTRALSTNRRPFLKLLKFQ